MKPAVESQFLSRAEAAVAVLASSGLGSWRTKPVDVELLCELPLVQEQMARPGHGSETDADTRRYAIEQAVEAAIRSLPETFRDAAFADFGTGDYWEASKRKRAEAAGAAFNKSYRWYEELGRSTTYHGKTPREYVTALVTCALCDISDPVSYLAREAASSNGLLGVSIAEMAPTRGPRLEPRSVAVAVGALALAIVTAAALGAFSTGSNEPRLPSPGSIVNAATGRVSPPGSLPVHPAVTSGQLGGGTSVLTACIQTGDECRFPPAGQPTLARPGDMLRLRLRLHDGEEQPISELRVTVSTEPHGAEVQTTALLEWPGVLSRDAGGIESIGVSARVKFADGKPHKLTYIPATSELLDRSSGSYRLLARLPEGLFGTGGIVLTNVGSPHGCWDCDLAYVRYIAFNMRVT